MLPRDDSSVIKSQKGITMPLVILIIAVVFIIASLTLTHSMNSTINVSNTVTIEKALQIAEAGYNHYMYYLYQTPDFHKNREGISIRGNNPSEELGFVPITFDTKLLPKEYETTTYLDENGEIIGYYKIRVNQPAVNKDLEVISTGWTYDNPNIKRTVSVKFYNKNYLNYVSISNTDSTFYPDTKINGSVYSDGYITIYGSPTFEFDVISGKSIEYRYGNPTIKGVKLENQPKLYYPAYYTDLREKGEKYPSMRLTGRTSIMLNNLSLTIINKDRNNDTKTNYRIPDTGIVFVDGPLFISGKINGRLTIYCTEDIYITGKDPTEFDAKNANKTNGIKFYNSTIPKDKYSTGDNYSTNMLGLVSEKNIILATKTWPDEGGGIKEYDNISDVFVDDMTICGVFRAADSFMLEPFGNGDYGGVKGELKIIGSKICNSSNVSIYEYNNSSLLAGYTEDLTYDFRLVNDFPPDMLRPEDMVWVLKSWEEIPNP